MAWPKIIYDAGAGPVTLPFTYPPTGKPMMYDRRAVRYDSFASYGPRQTMLERVDIVQTLTLENVPWDDLSGWADFVDYVIEGGPFAYYPDAAQPEFDTWELLPTEFKPQYAARGLSKFPLEIRMVFDGPSFP